MIRRSSLLIGVVCALLLSTPTVSQTTARERAAALRQQLAQLEARQEQLKTRLSQLEGELKPENIERELAGVGSTRPEELREQRRRQLELEKKSLQTQLDLIATSHTRLQTALAQADADAYRESAGGNYSSTQVSTSVANAPTARASVVSPHVYRRARPVRRNRSRPRRLKPAHVP